MRVFRQTKEAVYSGHMISSFEIFDTVSFSSFSTTSSSKPSFSNT
jgi:hypothetical protein